MYITKVDLCFSTYPCAKKKNKYHHHLCDLLLFLSLLFLFSMKKWRHRRWLSPFLPPHTGNALFVFVNLFQLWQLFLCYWHEPIKEDFLLIKVVEYYPLCLKGFLIQSIIPPPPTQPQNKIINIKNKKVTKSHEPLT